MNKQATVPVPQELLGGILNFVELSSFTTKRAVDEVSLHRGQQEKAAALRQPLLDHLVGQGLVDKSQTKEAEMMLGEHHLTMQLLKAAVDKIVELRGQVARPSQQLGQAVAEKTAGDSGYDSYTHPVVGGYQDHGLKRSDEAFLRGAQ